MPISDTNMRKVNLAFIDLETTGLDPDLHEIIEIGCVVARQNDRTGKGPSLEIVKEFEVKVQPIHIEKAEPEALLINGYNAQDWLFAVPLSSALAELSSYTKNSIMVAQNLTFDWGFLRAAYKKTGLEMSLHEKRKLDTVSMWFTKFYDAPKPDKFSLHYMAEFAGVVNPKAHSALADARTLFEIYRKVMVQ